LSDPRRQTKNDARLMGFFLRLWLRRQPLWVQCVVFALFAVLGGVFVLFGAMTGSWRAVGYGVLVAVAWPVDMFVIRPIGLFVQQWLRGDATR